MVSISCNFRNNARIQLSQYRHDFTTQGITAYLIPGKNSFVDDKVWNFFLTQKGGSGGTRRTGTGNDNMMFFSFDRLTLVYKIMRSGNPFSLWTFQE